MVKFNKNSIIKPKTYPPNCVVKIKNKQSIIIITHNECIFSVNNDVKKSCTQK